MADELKPCPFCGKPAQLRKTNIGYFVECSEYRHIHNAWVLDIKLKSTEEQAIIAWNTRAKENAPQATANSLESKPVINYNDSISFKRTGVNG